MSIIASYKRIGQKSKIILKNSFGAFIVKGASLVLSLLTTPAFIRYFNNNEVLGVWFTMLSVLIWFLNFDLGIGNGIRNQLTKDFTNNDYGSAKVTISSGFFSIIAVSIVLTVVGGLSICFADLNSFFNVEREIVSAQSLIIAAVSVFIAVMLRFMLTFVGSIFYALQKSAINNALSLCVSVLQYLFVVCFHFEDVNTALVNLAISYVFISNFPVIVAGVICFCGKLKNCRPNVHFIEHDRVKQIMSIGTIFFGCQILYMLIANTNEFLITKLYGGSYTVEYSFYYKITSILSTIVTLALTPIWSVVTKAATEKDFAWLNKLYGRFKVIGIALCALEFLIIPVLQPIMDLWLGKGSVDVTVPNAVAFASFSGVFLFSSMLSTIVCGLARMKVQFYSYLIGVILKFAVVLTLYRACPDWNLVVWSNVLVLLPYIVVQIIDLDKYLKKECYESSTN